VSFKIPLMLRLGHRARLESRVHIVSAERTLMQVALITVRSAQGATTVAMMFWPRTKTRTTQRTLNSP
jgi:hypothetical protein